MLYSQERILGWPHLRLDQRYHGWLNMMTSSEGPLFSLASGPPNPKPTTVTKRSVITICERCQLAEVMFQIYIAVSMYEKIKIDIVNFAH